MAKYYGLEKGYDGLFDLCYDYDINLTKTPVAVADFMDKTYDFYVLKARYIMKYRQIAAELIEHLHNEKRKYCETICDAREKSKLAGLLNDPKHARYCVEDFEEYMAEKEAKAEAYKYVRWQIKKLAESGDVKALAMYIAHESAGDVDAELLKKAKSIENQRLKTPEEWEVVAALYIKECPEEFIRLKIDYDVEDAAAKALFAHKNYIGAVEFGESENAFRFMQVFKRYHEAAMSTKYARAMQKTQLGYYARYFKYYGYSSDLGEYLAVTKDGRSNYIDGDAFETFSKGRYFSRDQISAILRNTYRKNKFNELTIPDKLAFAEALTGSILTTRKGMNLLREIAEIELENDKCDNVRAQDTLRTTQLMQKLEREL
ncbi:MAG: hypothetical protein J6K39_01640 [Clostridia bacterium]|nr:hypothetical protein [Clostridia bacterium]